MPQRLPLLAVILGIGGLIPLLASGVGALAWPASSDWSTRALLALVGCSAVILSFLGAVHWGLALAGDAPRGVVQSRATLHARLSLGVVPAAIGWAALLVTFIGLPTAALAVLDAGFIAVIIAEAQANRRGLLPPGYIWLRWALSIVVIVTLTSVALVRVMGRGAVF